MKLNQGCKSGVVENQRTYRSSGRKEKTNDRARLTEMSEQSEGYKQRSSVGGEGKKDALKKKRPPRTKVKGGIVGNRGSKVKGRPTHLIRGEQKGGFMENLNLKSQDSFKKRWEREKKERY